MVYDRKGHIDHVIKSPFTVYDWERSNVYLNKKISEIYKVGSLQFDDFLSARRGLFNYANDIKLKKYLLENIDFLKINIQQINIISDYREGTNVNIIFT